MAALEFHFSDQRLTALPSGALWIKTHKILCVSDLHLGKSDRVARRSGYMLPPYETQATLEKLHADVAQTEPQTVICLGDSFDDLRAADSLNAADAARLAGLQAGREWVWIEGNHDPGPVALGGTHLADWRQAGLVFRHIHTGEASEVSGHYHPKYAPPGIGAMRPCFLFDSNALIMPAYGTYTGGLRATDPALSRLLTKPTAILTGRHAIAVPVRRR